MPVYVSLNLYLINLDLGPHFTERKEIIHFVLMEFEVVRIYYEW